MALLSSLLFMERPLAQRECVDGKNQPGRVFTAAPHRTQFARQAQGRWLALSSRIEIGLWVRDFDFGAPVDLRLLLCTGFHRKTQPLGPPEIVPESNERGRAAADDVKNGLTCEVAGGGARVTRAQVDAIPPLRREKARGPLPNGG